MLTPFFECINDNESKFLTSSLSCAHKKQKLHLQPHKVIITILYNVKYLTFSFNTSGSCYTYCT